MPEATPPKPLTEAALRRLTNEAILSFLGEARNFEAHAGPGLCLALSNEPLADMNLFVVGPGVRDAAFEETLRPVLERSQPFLAMLFPETPPSIEACAERLGLAFAVEFPIMVYDKGLLEVSGNEQVFVTRGSGQADAEASARVLESAFKMPFDQVMNSLPASLMESPAVDIFVARDGDTPVGTVTLTYHGETCGVWAMGTDTARQRGGIGRRLLSSAMAQAQREGAKRFFLGATPAGYRLYEGLGYETRFSTRVWACGETNQA